MEAFLSVILFIFLGLWLFGLVGRWWLRRWITKRGQARFWGHFAEQRGQQSGQQRERMEGEVTVRDGGTDNRGRGRGVGRRVGEYVEFEEVGKDEGEVCGGKEG